MKIHTLKPERENLHGHFSRDLPPVLTIDSGDTVRYRTIDPAWGVAAPSEPGGSTESFVPRDDEKDHGHALCGPIEIQGAEPGMTLAVQINQIRPASWGWGGAGGRDTDLDRAMGVADGPRHHFLWELDAERMTGCNQHRHTITLHPFMGVMGMPPDEPGIHSTGPPRNCGGNLDCKELTAGATLFLPISVPGALFSVGDGHAVQGDGEISGVAIECHMDMVDLTFHLSAEELVTPRARTRDAWLTLGLDENLDAASLKAINGMLDLICQQQEVDRKQALALASLVVDLRVTQIVNGVRGVHAVLPHGAIA